MLNEHAVTYSEKITMKELDYLVKKANKLGRSGRDIVRVYQEEDGEGHHVYFEVTGLSKDDEWMKTKELSPSLNMRMELNGYETM